MKVREMVNVIQAAQAPEVLQPYCEAVLSLSEQARDVFEAARRRLQKQTLRRTFESCGDLPTAKALGDKLPKKSEEASWWEDWLIILSWQTMLESIRPSLTQVRILYDLPLSAQQHEVDPDLMRIGFQVMDELDALIPALAVCTSVAEAYELYNSAWSQIEQLPHERWVELADQEALVSVLKVTTSREVWAKLDARDMPEDSLASALYYARGRELEDEEGALMGTPLA